MVTGREIARFVDRLSRCEVGDDCCNFYVRDWSRGNAARRHNLQVYLEGMWAIRPKTILIAEAPGYRGTRVTGVPLTSQKIVITDPFYASLDLREVEATQPGSEATATIMHETLAELPERPLLWNSFPFHPHKMGLPETNRKPRAGEIMLGGKFVVGLIELFGINQVVAVGNSAEIALTKLSIAHHKVRHPSYGGKRDFQVGLTQLLSS